MASPKKPNILYIMADQMAAPLLRMYDPKSPIKTPNLDKLAERGVVFESAYCNSPLCAPSRFCMVTGQLPSKIEGFDNASNLAADVPTYAHYLRKEGYHTALSGKMHFVGPDQLHGFEQRLTSDIYPGDYGWTVNWDEPEIRPDWYHNMSSVLDAGPVVRTNQLDYDDEVIYKATQYLFDHVRHRAGQPFALTVSMTHPHDPYAMTKDFWDLYEDVEIPMPRTPAIPHDQQDPHSVRVLKVIDLHGKAMPEERIRAARRAYFAACTYVDAQIGKLLKTLEDCGAADETIVVFSGDHGDMLGERGLWYKMVWYEMAARVPLLVYSPKRYDPKRVKENVSTMDLMPTFAAMAGAPLQPGLPLDGLSLMPYIEGTNGPKPDTVIGEYMAEGTLSPLVMIRRGQWKFVYSPIDPPQLFDLVADPTESKNLAVGGTTGKLAEVLAAFLQEAAARWDFEAIREDVLRNQRRRRLVYSALGKGAPTVWDYAPPVDPSAIYVRNMSKGPLDDVEWISRWPRVAK
ncbi:Choline-sulfatase [Hypsibius exemplaris]|uniref:Choline-sulfatase n=1 Tax=Hypsibius exemplaris TaxID=2072580 RepID=A0A9X6RKJ2_HYPEX|nr:Choline-sulfatase [Hypsibius exemplaris]